MFESIVNAIKESVSPTAFEIDGKEYASKSVHLPPHESTVIPLKANTLSSIVEYLSGSFDDISNKFGNCCIHIIDHETVHVITEVSGRHKQRETLLIADCTDFVENSFPFGRPLTQEDFIVSLECGFVSDETTRLLKRCVSNIEASESITTADDGISMNLTIKRGARLTSDEKLQNPLTLRPFRTFGEIEQPASEFVLRNKENPKEEQPLLILHASENSQWKLEAIASISKYLKDALPSIQVIS